MWSFVGFGLVGGIIDDEQIVEIVSECATLRARPIVCTMPVGMCERHDMIDVDIGSFCEFSASVRADPYAGLDSAPTRVFELNRYTAGCNEHFLSGVLAVPVCINPVRPVFALVGCAGCLDTVGWLYLFGKLLTTGQKDQRQ